MSIHAYESMRCAEWMREASLCEAAGMHIMAALCFRYAAEHAAAADDALKNGLV